MNVEVRKPFVVTKNAAMIREDCWGVLCQGSKPLFPNVTANTLLVTFPTEEEAQSLADKMNEAFANHFDV